MTGGDGKSIVPSMSSPKDVPDWLRIRAAPEGQVADSLSGGQKLDIEALIAEADSTIAADDATLARAGDNNAFALALYSVLGKPDENLFCSPLSVRIALAMAAGGARRETAQELHAALHAATGDEGVHAVLAAAIRQLQRSMGATDELTIANSLWSEAGAPVLPAFAELIAGRYGASLNAVDFSRDPCDASRAINQWVSSATKQRIQELLPPSVLTTDTRLVLANAVYFKGAWQHPFEPEHTREAPFYPEDGGSVKARMMSQVARCGYRRGPGYQAVTLPYVGQALTMLVLLPEQGASLRILERALTVSMLSELVRLRPATSVKLFLPRFTITWGGDLIGALRALGIRRAFTREEADFSGINGRQPPDEQALYVSHVLQKAFSRVTEEGTEATAATAVDLTCFGLAGAPPPTPVFRADRPFLFAIGDARSGAVLFLGRVVDPTQDK